MDNNNNNQSNQGIKIELSPDVAAGIYSNLAVISHGPEEFFIDFITMAPQMPQAKVQSRKVMTPDNVKNLLHALADNVRKYEETFGEIKSRRPRQQGGGKPGEIPNPFIMGGKA